MKRNVSTLSIITAAIGCALGAFLASIAYDAILMRPTKPGDPANAVTIVQGHIIDRVFGFRTVPLRK